MQFGDETLWYDSKELLSGDEADQSDNEDEAIRRLLEFNLRKCRPFDRRLEFGPSRRLLLRGRFKPLNKSGCENLTIFGSNNGDQNSTRKTPNIESGAGLPRSKYAETILELRWRLQAVTRRLEGADTSLSRLRLEDGPTATATPSREDENPLWASSLSKLFWLAWPILLLAVLNKYWPPIRAKRIA